MLLLKDWKKEQLTIQLLTQILGKYCLQDRSQEPQWGHVMLGITPQGFTTGSLFYEDKTYSIDLNFVDHKIEIRTAESGKEISIENGKNIKTYYEEIKEALGKLGVHTKITTAPQEMEIKTLFDQDEDHHHYKPEIMEEFLELIHFAYKVETRFIHKLRGRKVLPGFFFGTFDLTSLIVNNKFNQIFKESQVIEYNAFDEELIEFGFWFGDDKYEGPTFFILAYPFLDDKFEFKKEDFPEGAVFDEKLAEPVFELKDTSKESEDKVLQFFEQGFKLLENYLGWDEYTHCTSPLTMPKKAFDGGAFDNKE